MKNLIEISDLRNKKINAIEKIKDSDTIKNSLLRIKNYKSYEDVTENDKKFFLKNFGIFDKAGEEFMVRVRVPAGKLTALQGAKIGEVTNRYGNRRVDITTRMQVEIRGVKAENLGDLIESLESVKITTRQTAIDNFRNILTDPFDDLALDSKIDTNEYVKSFSKLFMFKKEWTGTLPRKFNIGFNGSVENRTNIYGQDLGFVLAQRKEEIGFNIYWGGKVGVVSRCSNVFVSNLFEALHFFETLINIYKEYGFRDNRNKNRLHFFLQEIGEENLLKIIKEKAKYDFKDSGETLIKEESTFISQESIKLKNLLLAVKVNIPTGLFSGDDLIEASKLAQEIGTGDLRFDVNQNLHIIVQERESEKLLESELLKSYHNKNPFLNSVVACAGKRDCKFGIIESKTDTLELANNLHKKYPNFKEQFRIFVSGCPKGCGVHGFGDIGLEGCKAKVDGVVRDAVNIYIGGNSFSNIEGELIFPKVLLENTLEQISRVINLYMKWKNLNESIESFFRRIDRSHLKALTIN